MQVVDPQVSAAKFKQELDAFRSSEAIHRKRGIFLIKSSFPDMVFLFTAPQLRPQPIIFAVQINFDNYDLEPLSVQFVDPFDGSAVILAPVAMHRRVANEVNHVALVQKDDTGLPFICLPGIREYHRHPAHTGDYWLLHRNKGGEGSLGFILDKLYVYGIQGIGSFQMQMQAVIHAPAINFYCPPEQVPL